MESTLGSKLGFDINTDRACSHVRQIEWFHSVVLHGHVNQPIQLLTFTARPNLVCLLARPGISRFLCKELAPISHSHSP
jgi:hypothetical protein